MTTYRVNNEQNLNELSPLSDVVEGSVILTKAEAQMLAYTAAAYWNRTVGGPSFYTSRFFADRALKFSEALSPEEFSDLTDKAIAKALGYNPAELGS